MESKFLNIIGLMSGTSLDGIDISHVKTDGEDFFENINNYYYEYSPKIKQELKYFTENYKKLSLNKNLVEFYNNLINLEHQKALKKLNIMGKTDLIGYHGQTIYHNASKKISLQIGNPQKLANNLKKKVIFNFRSNDIKNGGQGAPLAPIYHKYMIEKLKIKLPCCFLNIGGISNITYWDGKNLVGFDTGPGNALMDHYVQNNLDLSYDKNGKIASNGKINDVILNKALDNCFFKMKPPKSLDKLHFNFILDMVNKKNVSLNDVMATLSEFTFLSILESFKYFPKKVVSLVIMGGGVHNKNLLKKFYKIKNTKVFTASDKNISSDYVESELIAYLTARSFYKIPYTFPSTTGVKEPLSGGEIFKPK